jgi:hypothetical protein
MIEAGQPQGVEQPKTFEFSAANLERAKTTIAKYPAGKQQSAIMGLLHIAQEQQGWLPTAAIAYCADMLGMPQIRAFEVASFYTQYARRRLASIICRSARPPLVGCAVRRRLWRRLKRNLASRWTKPRRTENFPSAKWSASALASTLRSCRSIMMSTKICRPKALPTFWTNWPVAKKSPVARRLAARIPVPKVARRR